MFRKAPDFAKMHERQFEQMESLDSYVAKKRQRTEAAQEQLHKVRYLNKKSVLIGIRLRLLWVMNPDPVTDSNYFIHVWKL